MPKEFRIFGCPGTGKTTSLSEKIAMSCRKFGSDHVMVASFTRTAAVELTGRGLPIPAKNVGTLHSFAFRSLGHPTIAEAPAHLKEWNSWVDFPDWKLSGGNTGSLDDPWGMEVSGRTEGDKLLQDVSRLRTKLEAVEGWPLDAQQFWAKWSTWKAESGVLDFTDLIADAYERCPEPPVDAIVGYFDEVQDFSPLELALVRRWGETMEFIVLAGDDDQCQPAGTMVSVQGGGKVPIEDLDPETHRVQSYDRHASVIVGARNGYRFKVSARDYCGSLFKLSLRESGRETRCTHHHRWLAKFDKSARRLYVTYLMRRGSWWRVGRCKLIRSDGVLHLGQRARLEGADAAWIVGHTEDKGEAWRLEQFYAYNYGIPQCCFEISEQATWLSGEDVADVYKMLGPSLDARAKRLLCNAALDIRFPFWSAEKAYERRGGTTCMTIQACNLIPQYMCIPVRSKGRRVKWDLIHSIIRDRYNGKIYALDVEPHHLYIADDVVTHNTIYSFRGSIPDAFLDPPIQENHKIVLPASYRLPRSIKAKAEDWIKQVSRREEKPFEARDAEGIIDENDATWRMPDRAVNDAIVQAKEGRTSMILASCGYMLEPTVISLKSRGATFHNPYRVTQGFWNPLRGGVDRLLAFCRPDRRVWGDEAHSHTWKSMRLWFEHIDIKKARLRRGAKKLVSERSRDEAWQDQYVSFQDFRDLGIEDPPMRSDWKWLRRRLRDRMRQKYAYAFEVCEENGSPEKLRDKPRIVVGTIHSVKGGQASNVYLFPDLSLAARQEMDSGAQGKDAVVRMFYVGMTRAADRLVTCQPSDQNCVTL